MSRPFRPQWQFKFQAHFDKWFGLPQCLKTYHLSLYNIKKDMLLTGPLAMLSMPSFDFHLPPCTEGFLIHLSPLWQLPLFPSVAQFPCESQEGEGGCCELFSFKKTLICHILKNICMLWCWNLQNMLESPFSFCISNKPGEILIFRTFIAKFWIFWIFAYFP